ncbi:hypothetical protein [uncultured Psychroserpens sp.]|uniref:hypothetical protein n=1 Tax=uncultured Psychroserpens sp. TaxID=255436 RepID=UPI00262857B9|nr:hypothetical protein [uncultured Psychroserpens sp.]
MKPIYVILIGILSMLPIQTNAQSVESDLSVLKGVWILDMSPQDTTDSNFAKMIITHADTKSLKGFFYRDGVKIRNGKTNTQTHTIYAALISGDGTGDYNTSFYYKDGILYGTTHAVDRDFLSVWTATKEKE